MANRFPSKSCVLCPNPSEGVGEHVWSHWFIQEFRGSGPFTTSKGGVAYTKRDGVTPVKAQALPGSHVPMCSSCNGQLNRTIEQPVKAVVRRLLSRPAVQPWPAVPAGEAAALAKWLLKVGLLKAHPDVVHDHPQMDRDPDVPRLDHVDPAWLDWMRTGTAPPSAFSVYVTRRSLTGEQPWQGKMERIFLPRVSVGGQLREFMSRSFGMKGLDVTIVWHPGWPILHPLAQTARAAVLWPNPSAVDFGQLPEIHPDEFRFHPALGSMHLTDVEFLEVTRTPLQVGVDPMRHYFGNTTSTS